MQNRTLLSLWSLLLLWTLGGSLSAQPDTLRLTEFYQLLRDHHPVAQQTDLIPREALAQLRLARGSFDPKLFGDAGQKVSGGTNYYRHIDGGLKVMTPIGVEVKAGYEQNIGENVSSEIKTSKQGLMYAGISVPLGQGLLIDPRRAALRQAKIFQQSTTAQRLAQLNQLFFDATKAYWEWSEARSVLRVQNQAVAFAEQRFSFVREQWRFGEKAAMDTLEALIQLQTRLQSQMEADLAEQKARLVVSNFLWDSDGQPLVVDNELEPNALPVDEPANAAVFDSTVTWLSNLSTRHPEMQLLRFKLAELEVKRRLKADKLKPKVLVNYNLINRPILIGEDPAPFQHAFLENNYKWGLTLDFPLFLRKERGNLELTRLKIRSTEFKQDLKLQELTNKVLAYQAELQNRADQLELYEETVRNYEALLEAEVFKFRSGKSSLFLVNSRETKLIEARVKLLQLQTKFRKAAAGLAWSAGALAS